MLENTFVLEELLSVLVKKDILTHREAKIIAVNAVNRAKKTKEEMNKNKKTAEQQEQLMGELDDQVFPFIGTNYRHKIIEAMKKYWR